MSKGELEDSISRALTAWEKEYLGRGPIHVKTDIVRNIVVVVLKGILSVAEQALASTKEGLVSIKRIRMELVESGSDQLKQIIRDLTGTEVVSVHTDLSTKTGERIIIFMMKDSLE